MTVAFVPHHVHWYEQEKRLRQAKPVPMFTRAPILIWCFYAKKRRKEMKQSSVLVNNHAVLSLATFKRMDCVPYGAICKLMWYIPRRGGRQMTLYLEEDRHCDPSTADSHEEEATNHQRSSAQTLDSKTLRNRQRGKVIKQRETVDFLSFDHRQHMVHSVF